MVVLLLVSALVCQAQLPFTDVTVQAGIDHQFVVFEGMFGGGACVFDLNNDGFEDLYITGGMRDDVLYLNQGDGTFTNIYAQSGLQLTRHYVTQGVAGADVNRDGWVDLFITTITSRDSVKLIPREINLLFLNNGNGTFRDATREYGLDQLYSFSTGASFGDLDADGFPDLYVGNYFLEYDGTLSRISDATIVGAHQTARGYLLHNEAGRRFTNVYEQYGLDYRGFGFGAVFTDFDNDADQDLFVNHDFGYKATPDYLLQNDYPRAHLYNVAESMDLDLKINSMGTAIADINNDGFMDYYMTNIRFNHMMVSRGTGQPFVNELKARNMNFVSISWGANFADFDHDGDVDLFVANGDLNPNCVPMSNFYFTNTDGIFVENARAAGVNDYGISRGSVVFDIENDGDLDLLVINQKPVLDYPVASFTRLFRNDSAVGNWLKVSLAGVQAESHGLGSRIEIVAGGRHMIREIDGGGSSHLSQNSTLAHFGLGQSATVDSVIVTWTGGKRQVLTHVQANTLLTVVEAPAQKTGFGWLYRLLGIALVVVAGYFWARRRNS